MTVGKKTKRFQSNNVINGVTLMHEEQYKKANYSFHKFELPNMSSSIGRNRTGNC